MHNFDLVLLKKLTCSLFSCSHYYVLKHLCVNILFKIVHCLSHCYYFSCYFFFYIYNLHFFKQKVYSHQVLIYLNVPGIPVRKPLQNRQIVEEQLDVWVLGVICASFLTGRHLLMNKKDKNSRYTKIKIMIIWRKT